MIGWWSHSDDLRVASVRIRGELLMRALQTLGIDVGWFDPRKPQAFDILVIGKRHDAATLKTAAEFRARGGKVIVDLCDNRFEYPATALELHEQAQQLKQLLLNADHVVSSTAELARTLQSHCPTLEPVSVIGDLTDDLSVVPVAITQRVSAKIRLQRSLTQLRRLRATNHTLLIWFGTHGGAYAEAGMNDLLRIRGLLEECHRATPLALTIISNNAEKFQRNIAPFALPTRYEQWHATSFDRLLQAHDISLIPINDNAFTRCKTDNRVVTSLLNGLAVVADDIPSYRPYTAAIALGDWETRLPQYLRDPALRRHDVATGRAIATQLTDPQLIARQWQAVFKSVGLDAKT